MKRHKELFIWRKEVKENMLWKKLLKERDEEKEKERKVIDGGFSFPFSSSSFFLSAISLFILGPLFTVYLLGPPLAYIYGPQ